MKKILQVAHNNYESQGESMQRYSPLQFGYNELNKLGYHMQLIYPEPLRGMWKIIKLCIGNYANDLCLQFRCIKASKQAELLYYPIDRHCILLAILRKIHLIKCPIVMLCHFSLNIKYVPSFRIKLLKIIERYFVFRFMDTIVFPCERLRNIAIEGYPLIRKSGLVHWGADPDWYGVFSTIPSKCEYYMSCGGTNRDYETLIEAFRQTDINLKIYTSDQYISSLKLLDITDNIELISATGAARKELLRRGYGEARAVLIPLKYRNDVPNGATVFVEAIAAGRPVLISDFETNFVDVNIEKTGIKVAVRNAADWRQKLQYLEANPDVLDEYGKNAFLLANQKFNLKNLAKELGTYFDRL